MSLRAKLKSQWRMFENCLTSLLSPSLFRPSLSGKLILLMSLGIVLTSSALGWYLANNSVDLSREALLKNGTILANNLASNGRYSVYTKDQLRLGQLIETALNTEEVVYVQFIGSDGHIILRETKGQRSATKPFGRAPAHSLFPPREITKTGLLATKKKIIVTPFAPNLKAEEDSMESLSHLVSSWIFKSPFSETLYDFSVPIFRGNPSLNSNTSSSFVNSAAQESVTTKPLPVSSQPISGLLQLGLSNATMTLQLQTIVGKVLLITLLVILFGVTATVILARRIITPLNSLTTMANQIKDGHFSVTPLPRREDEIGHLNAAFVHMLAALKERDSLVQSQISCLKALQNTEEVISISANEGTLLSSVLNHIHKEAGFRRVLLGLFNLERQTLYGIEIRGDLAGETFSLHSREELLEPKDGILRQLLTHGGSLLVTRDTVLNSPSDSLLLHMFSQMNADSCILCSLKSEHQILGFIAVESGPIWNEVEDMAFVHAVASQTGIALDRLRAYTRLEEAKTTLESRVQDRTQELQDANEKLLEVDRLRAKFVAVTSHELRTPLTAIKMFSDNMLCGIVGPVENKQKYYLSRINANVQRLHRLIRDLLDLAHIESGHMRLSFRLVNLRQIIEEVIEELIPEAETHGVNVRVQLPIDCPDVEGDGDKIFQIMNNLVHNAIKFTESGGIVTITMEALTNKNIQICIADTGCGIAPKELENVFQPFYRIASMPSPNSGVGLGLALTRELVTLHHGNLWAESTPEDGSRFYVSFPSPPYEPHIMKSKLGSEHETLLS